METFLSLDPGLEDTGWAVIDANGKQCLLRDFGLIKTSNKNTLSKRLSYIYDEILKLIKRYSITQGAIESMFFTGKVKTQVFSFYAKGVILLAFEKAGIVYGEYNPRTVKRLVCGNGNANKKQINNIIKTVFGINENIYPDVSDAIAIGMAATKIFFMNKRLS